MTVSANPPEVEFDRQYAAEQIRRSRHPLRRFIKNYYLRNILRDVHGPAIDFGCGAGQLLARLSPGSAGLEVNKYLIDDLRSAGLTVYQARATMQDFELVDFAADKYRTLVIAHVLEHLPDPAEALHVLLTACLRLGIDRVVVVVPGARGYVSDRTHKTFIDRTYLESKIPRSTGGFVRSAISYFPGPWEWVGRYFVYQEMKVIFDRVIEPS